MMGKKKIAFICIHNFCRSQIAEALGKHLAGDKFDFYSAGTETKPQINQDAVRIRLHPNANLIERIEKIDDTVYSLAGGAGSQRGTGSMKTKLQAAEFAMANGIDTIITNGKNPEALYEIIRGNCTGTLFTGRSEK